MGEVPIGCSWSDDELADRDCHLTIPKYTLKIPKKTEKEQGQASFNSHFPLDTGIRGPLTWFDLSAAEDIDWGKDPKDEKDALY